MVIVSSNQNLADGAHAADARHRPECSFKVTLANLETFKYKAFDTTFGPIQQHQ